MNLRFQKNIEDFVCENCGFKAVGNGYTNHCPQCLWSKHMDINPGDRENKCQGMMKPVRIEMKGQEMVIMHRCKKCRTERKNKVADGDNREMIRKVSSESITD